MAYKFPSWKTPFLISPERARMQPPERLFNVIGLHADDVLVDIGTGTGFFIIPAAALVKAAYGLDVSQEMLDKCARQITAAGLQNVRLRQMDENGIPLDDAFANKIICVNVLHELENPDKILSDIKRILQPGGLAAIVDWKKEQTEAGPPVEDRIDVADAAKSLQNAGFDDIEEHDIYQQHYVLIAKSE